MNTRSHNRGRLYGGTTVTVIGILAAIALVAALIFIRPKTIHGNEVGVRETWGAGVVNEVLQPKTYFLGPSETIYAYDMSPQNFVMNNKPHHVEQGIGRDADSYRVPSQEGQPMTLSATLQWRLDPTKIVSIHKSYHGKIDQIEERLIRPVMMRVLKDEGTTRRAIDAYAGEGLVKFQSAVQQRLSDPTSELAQNGITVMTFVLEENELDPAYIAPILARQIATQQQLAAVEQQKAADAAALVAKAVAQADYNQQLVVAERDKQKQVIAAEASNQQQILQAQAEKQKRELEAQGSANAAVETAKGEAQKIVLEADAKLKQSIAQAQGIEATGKAEATAIEAKNRAYAVPGSDSLVRIKVAEQLANAFQNIRGFIPQNMNITTLSGAFLEAVENVTGNAKAKEGAGLEPAKNTVAQK